MTRRKYIVVWIMCRWAATRTKGQHWPLATIVHFRVVTSALIISLGCVSQEYIGTQEFLPVRLIKYLEPTRLEKRGRIFKNIPYRAIGFMMTNDKTENFVWEMKDWFFLPFFVSLPSILYFYWSNKNFSTWEKFYFSTLYNARVIKSDLNSIS